MTVIDETRSLFAIAEEEMWEVPDEETAAREQETADLAWATERSRWLANAQKAREELSRIHQAEIDRLEVQLTLLRERATEIEAPLTRKITYLEGALKAYALRERDRTHGRTKSVKLMYATVSTSEKGGGWEVDQDIAVEWAKAHRPDLVETVDKFLLAKAKAVPGWTAEGSVVVDAESGEQIPGLHVLPKQITASVKLADS